MWYLFIYAYHMFYRCRALTLDESFADNQCLEESARECMNRVPHSCRVFKVSYQLMKYCCYEYQFIVLIFFLRFQIILVLYHLNTFDQHLSQYLVHVVTSRKKQFSCASPTAPQILFQKIGV